MSLTTNIRGNNTGLSSPCKQGKRGVAAMEFALTLPIWIALLIGVTDGAYLMLLSQRADRIAYTVTDLVTQSEATPSINNLNTILLAAGQLMQPFPFGENGVVIITSIRRLAGQAPEICWQHIGGGSLARASRIGRPGLPPQLPAGLTLNDNENIIASEVYYFHRPIFINAGIFSEGDFYRVAVYKPRLSPLCHPPG